MEDMESDLNIIFSRQNVLWCDWVALGWVVGQECPVKIGKTTEVDARTEDCSPKSESDPIAEDSIHTAHWMKKGWAGACVQPSLLHSSLLAREGTLQDTEYNLDIKSATKASTSNLSYLQDVLWELE